MNTPEQIADALRWGLEQADRADAAEKELEMVKAQLAVAEARLARTLART